MAAIPTVFSHPTLYVVIGALTLLITAARFVFSGSKEELHRWMGGEPRLNWVAATWLFCRLIDMVLVAIAIFLVYLIIAFPFTLAALWPGFAHAMLSPFWRAFPRLSDCCLTVRNLDG